MPKQRTTKRQREQAQAEQRQTARAERELAHASRPLFGTGGTGKSPNKIPTLETPAFAKDSSDIVSVLTASPFFKHKPVRYEEDMAIREAAAQQEIERKKKRVAVVCHKSGYQYVGEAEDPRTFGKKSQALE